MSALRRARFAPTGALALLPSALGQEYDVTTPAATTAPACDLAVVSIRGPLVFHRTLVRIGSETVDVSEFDSYEAIEGRVMCALEIPGVQRVILDIDSPGGLVAGCFELAQEIRDAAAAKGKTLHAQIQGYGASAAYALACACSTISASATAVVGSIGVLEGVVDATAQDTKNGLAWTLIASGQRKADGNPHNPLTPDAAGAMQLRVDDLAAVFFDFVAEARGVSADAVRALDADTFVGVKAKELGLVDTIGTFSSQVAMLNGPENLVLARQAAARHPSGYVAQSILPELEARYARKAERAAAQARVHAASEAAASAARAAKIAEYDREIARCRRSVAQAERSIQARALEEYRYLNPHR